MRRDTAIRRLTSFRRNTAFRHDVSIRPDTSLRRDTYPPHASCRRDTAFRHDTSLRPNASLRPDTAFRPDASLRHDAPNRAARVSKRPLLLLTFLAAALLATGCASTRPVHYYTLAPASVPTNQSKPDGPVILIGLIATPEFLQDSRIRYRAGANEVGAYEYHRWTERPGEMIRFSLLRAMRASGQYQHVLEATSAAFGDYLVRGKLYEFAEMDSPAIETRISLHLELIDRKTNHSIWDRAFERAEPSSGKAINDVVASMDRNLQQLSGEVAAEIGRFLSGKH